MKLVSKMTPSVIVSKESKLIVGSEWCEHKLTMVVILEADISS